MEELLLADSLTEEDLLHKALEKSESLPAYIWELDKLLTFTHNRIEALAKEHQASILSKHDTLQGAADKIAQLVKKGTAIDVRLNRLKRNYSEEVEAIRGLLQKLDILAKVTETVKAAQTLGLKAKNPVGNKADLQGLANKLAGLDFAESVLRKAALS